MFSRMFVGWLGLKTWGKVFFFMVIALGAVADYFLIQVGPAYAVFGALTTLAFMVLTLFAGMLNAQVLALNMMFMEALKEIIALKHKSGEVPLSEELQEKFAGVNPMEILQ